MTSIIIWAVPGIGEVGPGTDVADLVLRALDDAGDALCDGDIVVVTSKVVSKAEGRLRPTAEREDAVTAESAGTVARRGALRIVRTRAGLVLAAAGVDASNLPTDQIALLPVDADASAAALRQAFRERGGCDVGVLISDTAGRAWRVGQTDQAIGAAGVRLVEHYAGRHDAYGNHLHVTARALADEITAAADLVKGKLRGRPVAVVRGLAALVVPGGEPAGSLVRPVAQDLFRWGTRESLLWGVLAGLEATGRFEELVALTSAEVVAAVRDGLREHGVPEAFVRQALDAVGPGGAPPGTGAVGSVR